MSPSQFAFVHSTQKFGKERRLRDMLMKRRSGRLVKWDQRSLASSMGPAAVELLIAGIEGYSKQANKVELFGKIWPPPNV